MSNKGTPSGLDFPMFPGGLSNAALSHLKNLDGADDEAVLLARRALKWMRRAGLSGRDVSEFATWMLGFLWPRMVPGNWEGAVPPITTAGRHQKLDDLVASRYEGRNDNRVFLDVGCGYPPLTTIETSKRLIDWDVIGLDPIDVSSVVTAANGDYGCFNADANIVYFQPAASNFSQWESMFKSRAETLEKFKAAHAELSVLAANNHRSVSMETSVGTLTAQFNPLEALATPQLKFIKGGIGTDIGQCADVIRCMNVLLYFDENFRAATLEWAAHHLKRDGVFIAGVNWTRCTSSRYSVYTKSSGPGFASHEFSFSIDNIRPSVGVSWIAFHDTDFETQTLAELVGVLRSDEQFVADFDIAVDDILRCTGICPPDSQGYLTNVPPGLPSAEFERRILAIESSLHERNLGHRAVSILKKAGYSACLNEANDLTVRIL
jgi:SAM-dependent methyltransferase